MSNVEINIPKMAHHAFSHHRVKRKSLYKSWLVQR